MADFLARTRTSYDAMAVDYVAHFGDDLDAYPIDRALLAVFAELVRGPVVEVGCGTGRVTGHLHSLGVEVRGIDLSPGMLELARAQHPEVLFEEGSLLELDLHDLAGVVAFYSIIHVPPAHLPLAIEGLARSLRPGGWALLAFQTDSQLTHYDEAWGHAVDLDFHRHAVEDVCALLEQAGLGVMTRVVREPEPGREQTRQGYVLATRRG